MMFGGRGGTGEHKPVEKNFTKSKKTFSLKATNQNRIRCSALAHKAAQYFFCKGMINICPYASSGIYITEKCVKLVETPGWCRNNVHQDGPNDKFDRLVGINLVTYTRPMRPPRMHPELLSVCALRIACALSVDQQMAFQALLKEALDAWQGAQEETWVQQAYGIPRTASCCLFFFKRDSKYFVCRVGRGKVICRRLKPHFF